MSAYGRPKNLKKFPPGTSKMSEEDIFLIRAKFMVVCVKTGNQASLDWMMDKMEKVEGDQIQDITDQFFLDLSQAMLHADGDHRDAALETMMAGLTNYQNKLNDERLAKRIRGERS